MKKHSDKGRYLVALAVIESNNISHELWMTALECIENYFPE